MRKIGYYKLILLVVCVCLILFSLIACEEDTGYKKSKLLDTTKSVTLKIASGKDTWTQLEDVITKFEKVYPNCTVDYEYIENYSEIIETRLSQDEQKVDIFTTVNIQEDSPFVNYALNLISEQSKKYLDLSKNNSGLVNNFKYTLKEDTQYAIPYGGEMRGLYVNITLLESLGLTVPTNRSELLNCCEVLYKANYIPFQAENSSFAQQLLYPYICNSIVNGGNYEEMYQAIENIDEGISEYFRDAYTFLYEILEKGYYDYKRVEKELGYTFNGSETKAREFLNIIPDEEGNLKKKDDVGKIAFMTDTQAFQLWIDKAKADYHSEINYKFITSPVGYDGGYGYLSPSDGLAINKKSDNTEWALEFLNFLFTPEINEDFAEASGIIPNTANALLKYDVDPDHSCNVGEVTFSYSFYKVVTTLITTGTDDMLSMIKLNATKYMIKDNSGNLILKYTVDDYLKQLEMEFQKVKAKR